MLTTRGFEIRHRALNVRVTKPVPQPTIWPRLAGCGKLSWGWCKRIPEEPCRGKTSIHSRMLVRSSTKHTQLRRPYHVRSACVRPDLVGRPTTRKSNIFKVRWNEARRIINTSLFLAAHLQFFMVVVSALERRAGTLLQNDYWRRQKAIQRDPCQGSVIDIAHKASISEMEMLQQLSEFRAD